MWSSSTPSASPPHFDFSGYFKVFIPLARWFIIIGTLYNAVFLQSALQSFFSPYCAPRLPSPATIIGFGGSGASFLREKEMLFLIGGTFWGFFFFLTFVSLLFFFWSHALQFPVTLGLFAPPQTCTHHPSTHTFKVSSAPHGPLFGLTSGLQVVKKQWSFPWTDFFKHYIEIWVQFFSI